MTTDAAYIGGMLFIACYGAWWLWRFVKASEDMDR